MLVGLILSAIFGGITGAAWSIGQDHEIVQILASYPLGGMAAVLVFILVTNAGDGLPRQRLYFRPD